MTKELEVGLIVASTLLSGASVSVGFYLLHKRVRDFLIECFNSAYEMRKREYAELKAGLKAEFQAVHSKMELLDTEMHAKVEQVGHLVRKEASDLKTHAENTASTLGQGITLGVIDTEKAVKEHAQTALTNLHVRVAEMIRALREDSEKALSIFEHHSNDLKNHAAALKTNAQETQDQNAASSLSRFQRSVPSR